MLWLGFNALQIAQSALGPKRLFAGLFGLAASGGDGKLRFLSTGSERVLDTAGDTDAGERVTVPVSGGVLVSETRAVGKELVGFERVDDWDTLADALAAKGHDRGAVFHLPVLDE